MTPPGVTVIMPTFNRAGYIAESLDAVLGQTVPPNQVIVVNDGSSDDTETVLAPYMDRIEYLSKENEGKPIALNTAMPMVRGDYVWVMDDDDVAVPEALERHLAILEARPEVGFTYSACYISTTGADGRIVRGPISPYYVSGVPEAQVFTRLMDACFLNHPGILVRKACYDAVGPFDVELIRSQDYDIMLRLARLFTGAEVTEPSYDQRQHQGARGTGAQAFAAEQAVARWYEFDRHIFTKLHADMDLREYLPKDEQGTGEDADFDRRAALIKRLSVTGRRG